MVRVVFIASDADTSEESLNSRLLSGATLQSEVLLSIRFRIALTGDIKVMYRQIFLKPEDRKCLHIFFQLSKNRNEVLEFEMNTVVYIHISSGFLAQRTLRHSTGKVIFSTYMDNVLTGAKNMKFQIL